jgi:hypothetical protein
MMKRLLSFAAFAAAGVLGVRLARREWRRVNAQLDRTRGHAIPPAGTLRRDAATGEWRTATRL